MWIRLHGTPPPVYTAPSALISYNITHGTTTSCVFVLYTILDPDSSQNCSSIMLYVYFYCMFSNHKTTSVSFSSVIKNAVTK